MRLKAQREKEKHRSRKKERKKKEKKEKKKGGAPTIGGKINKRNDDVHRR